VIAALILALSLVALAQFFVYYCRALLAEASTVECSADSSRLGGISGAPSPGDFACLVLLARTCGVDSARNPRLAAVRFYFAALRRLSAVLPAAAGPAAAGWTQSELAGCAHFAAVHLDQQIARNRELFAQRHSAGL